MAKQRYINTRFWDDSYIVTLDPTEKLLFLYLLTNPLTEISGAYEIPLRRIAFDTGIDREMVLKILGRFESEDRVVYRDGWILICNFIKHQAKNPKIKKGIETSVNGCPDWIKDRLSIGYDTLSHLNSNTNTNTNTNTNRSGGAAWTGRLGIRRNQTPINQSSDLELQTWLAAVAGVVGAKDANGLPTRRKWEDACMTLIREQRNLAAFLKVVQMERARNQKTPHFFSPDSCLKVMQMNGTESIAPNRSNVATGRQQADEADRIERELLNI